LQKVAQSLIVSKLAWFSVIKGEKYEESETITNNVLFLAKCINIDYWRLWQNGKRKDYPKKFFTFIGYSGIGDMPGRQGFLCGGKAR
jgi:hypothetical protein